MERAVCLGISALFMVIAYVYLPSRLSVDARLGDPAKRRLGRAEGAVAPLHVSQSLSGPRQARLPAKSDGAVPRANDQYRFQVVCSAAQNNPSPVNQKLRASVHAGSRSQASLSWTVLPEVK